VSAATFIAAGMAPKLHWSDRWELARRFGVAAIGFVVVTVLLTHTLVKIVRDRYLTNAIQSNIEMQFSQFPSTSLVSAIHQEYQGKLYILATVRTPKVIDPNRVKSIQDDLSHKLGIPTELIVRVSLTKDVSATGCTSQVTAQNLNDFFLGGKLAPDVLTVQSAEQALREILAARPDLILKDVDLLHFPRGPVIMATIQGSRPLIPEEIEEFQKSMQERLHNPKLRLLARCLTTVDVDPEGRVLYGWAHFGSQSPQERALQDHTEAVVRQEFKKFSDLFVTNVDVISKDDAWAVRVEAVGTRAISPRELAGLESALSRQVQKPTKIYLWFRGEAMITDQGTSSMEEFTRKGLMEKKIQPRRPRRPAWPRRSEGSWGCNRSGVGAGPNLSNPAPEHLTGPFYVMGQGAPGYGAHPGMKLEGVFHFQGQKTQLLGKFYPQTPRLLQDLREAGIMGRRRRLLKIFPAELQDGARGGVTGEDGIQDQHPVIAFKDFQEDKPRPRGLQYVHYLLELLSQEFGRGDADAIVFQDVVAQCQEQAASGHSVHVEVFSPSNPGPPRPPTHNRRALRRAGQGWTVRQALVPWAWRRFFPGSDGRGPG
jgi:hypothetical protein